MSAIGGQGGSPPPHFAMSPTDPSPLQWFIHNKIMSTVSMHSTTRLAAMSRLVRRRRRLPAAGGNGGDDNDDAGGGNNEEGEGDIEDGEDVVLVNEVANYTAYYGNGAVLLPMSEALAAFGQPSLAEARGFPNPFPLSNKDDDAAAPVMSADGSNGGARIVPWDGLPPFSDLVVIDGTSASEEEGGEHPSAATFLTAHDQNSVILVRYDGGEVPQPPASATSGAAHRFIGRYPNAKFHLGETPSGEEAVVEGREVADAMHRSRFTFRPQMGSNGGGELSQKPSPSQLYVADNTFFAEAYDEEFLLPTNFMRSVWSARIERDVAAEDGAPKTNGRPLTAPWILWGCEGTYSSPHTEPSNSRVWVHVFEGAKRWCVFNERARRWEAFEQPEGTTVFMGRQTWHAVLNVHNNNNNNNTANNTNNTYLALQQTTPAFAIAMNYIPKREHK